MSYTARLQPREDDGATVFPASTFRGRTRHRRRDVAMPSMPVHRLGSPRRHRATACRSATSGSWSTVAAMLCERSYDPLKDSRRNQEKLIRDILCRLAAGSVVPRKMTCGPGSGLGRHKPCKVACHRALGTVHEDRHSLGQRFLDSNHIRRPRRACRTMCE
jgi:hypothetical protein